MFLKKITFLPFFLIFITGAIYSYKLILDLYLDVYFKTYGGLYEFALLSVPLILASLTYCLFITFSQDLKYALGAGLLAALTPFIFLPLNLSIVISIGILISCTLIYFNLHSELKSYVNFQPSKLLKEPIKLLNTFILFSLTFGYFLNANSIVQTQGFKIPDSIIDWSIDLSLKGQGIPVKGAKYLAQLPTLTEEQIDLLKQNPEVLKQFGVNPADLDQLTPTSEPSPTSPNQNAVSITPSLPTTNLKDMLKAQISNSLDQTIKPYLFIIPFLLAFMFYSLASLIIWIFSFFLSPIISLVFNLLEKTGFLKYEKEVREVKKIII